MADAEGSVSKLEATERKLALSLAEAANLEEDIAELERRLSEMEEEMSVADEAAKVTCRALADMMSQFKLLSFETQHSPLSQPRTTY